MNPTTQPPPILVFHYRNEPPFRVDETLSINAGIDANINAGIDANIDASGQITLRSPASAEPNLRHCAGTYGARLDAGGLAQAQALARELAALPQDDNLALARHGIEIDVVAEIDGKKQWHALNFASTTGLPQPLADALRLSREWKSAAAAVPLAVVEVGAELSGGSGKPRLALTFRSVGEQPVRFLLKPDLLAVRLEENGRLTDWWQNGAALRTGLIGPMGVLVDGLRAPAEIEPGKKAVLLVEVDQSLPAGWHGGAVSLEGYISLVEPGVSPPSAPQTRFTVQAKI